MSNAEFIRICKEKVCAYTNEHMDKTDKKKITVDDVYVVWCCKTLQNHKALLSTTAPDGMYYEFTYNGDKDELYMDAYKKWENLCYQMEGERKIMKKAMLSQPMAGKTDEEIIATREQAIKVLEAKGYEIVNTLFTDEWYSNEKMKERGVVQIPLCFLAKSLENMSLCHAAYFCKGWENARGCRIEHDAAVAYGLDVIYEA